MLTWCPFKPWLFHWWVQVAPVAVLDVLISFPEYIYWLSSELHEICKIVLLLPLLELMSCISYSIKKCTIVCSVCCCLLALLFERSHDVFEFGASCSEKLLSSELCSTTQSIAAAAALETHYWKSSFKSNKSLSSPLGNNKHI